MAKYDVYRLGDGIFVIDCQADLLSDLETRFVLPLVPAAESWGHVRRLNPTLPFRQEPHVLLPQEAMTLNRRELASPIGSLAEHDLEIGNALDMLISGF